MLLQGRVAIVSGVGPGLGREAALSLAEEGAHVALVARSSTVADQVRGEISALGRNALCIQADVTDPSDCQAALEQTMAALGPPDILVNNAFYTGDAGPVMGADLDDWRKVIDVNLFGSLNMTRAVVPEMQRRGEGRIIMVNSLQAWKVVDGFGAYSASKNALSSVTRTLAAELGPSGIRVNAIHPGLIMGDSVRQWFTSIAHQQSCSYDDVYRQMTAATALGYIPDAREMAGAVVFLASDLAKPITGQSIGLNAGEWFH